MPGQSQSRTQFVHRDQVLDHLKKMPKDTDGLLVVSPIGQDSPDDYAQLAMFTNPDHAFGGSTSFLINARTGDDDHYELLDLNNLPTGIEVELQIRATDGSWEQSSTFRGTEGNIQNGAGA